MMTISCDCFYAVLFACVYFCLSTGNQLLYNYPKFYSYHLPAEFVRDNANVSLAVEGRHVTVAPWNNLLTLTSSAGQQFLSFAKYTDYGRGWRIILLMLSLSFNC